MNIGLLVHPYSRTAPGGLGRANAMLSHAIAEADPANEYTFFVKGTDAAVGVQKGANWKTVLLGNGPTWLTGGLDASLDAYVFFTPIIPLFFKPKKSVVIALDFAFLDIPPRSVAERLSSALLYFLQARALRLATKIVSISEATKQSAIQHFGIASEKIEAVHIGFMPLAGSPKPIDVPERFVLFAGVLKERKNVSGVVKAFAEFHAAHPEYALVIAGKTEGAYYQSLVELARALSISDSVRFIGYVSDDELAYLYAKARALVFPSLLEGFGMPVLEAMEKGLPVVTSNDGSLAEIAGDAAVLVDPRNPYDIAQGIARIVDDESARDDFIARGRVRAAQFSWEKAGRRLAEIIRAL